MHRSALVLETRDARAPLEARKPFSHGSRSWPIHPRRIAKASGEVRFKSRIVLHDLPQVIQIETNGGQKLAERRLIGEPRANRSQILFDTRWRNRRRAIPVDLVQRQPPLDQPAEHQFLGCEWIRRVNRDQPQFEECPNIGREDHLSRDDGQHAIKRLRRRRRRSQTNRRR